MPSERISEVETKLFTHEGRIKSYEQDMRQLQDNVDRIESHLLEVNSRPFPIGAVISGVVGILGVMGTAIFGVLNYVDGKVEQQLQVSNYVERRVQTNADELGDLTTILHDRVGRLEERVASQGREIAGTRHNHSQ
jgi:uncharacterized coiled-coil protein SlyX